jgi:hypothetical protein
MLNHVALWVAAAYRIGQRDAAVRVALALMPGVSRRGRAIALETALTRYLAGAAWRAERRLEVLPATATELQRALHQVARLSSGDGLRWRRIFDIGAGVQETADLTAHDICDLHDEDGESC